MGKIGALEGEVKKVGGRSGEARVFDGLSGASWAAKGAVQGGVGGLATGASRVAGGRSVNGAGGGVAKGVRMAPGLSSVSVVKSAIGGARAAGVARDSRCSGLEKAPRGSGSEGDLGGSGSSGCSMVGISGRPSKRVSDLGVQRVRGSTLLLRWGWLWPSCLLLLGRSMGAGVLRGVHSRGMRASVLS